jgi:hypothetical protein
MDLALDAGWVADTGTAAGVEGTTGFVTIGGTGDSKGCVVGSSFIRGSCVWAPVFRVLCFLVINATDCAKRKCRTDVTRVKN